MNRAFWAISLVASIATSAPAMASDEQAQIIVARYQEQIANTSGISYEFVHQGTQMLAAAFPPTQGTVKAIPSKGQRGLYQRARISATSQVGEQHKQIEVAADSELVRSLDPDNQRVLNAPKWRNGVDLVNFQYLLPLALIPELASLKPVDIHYAGEEQVNGVDCWVVKANSQMANFTLYFGKEDALLYRGVGRKPNAWGEATIEMSFGQMTIDRRFADIDFALDTPQGYTEFAYSGKFPDIGAPAPAFALSDFADGQMISDETLRGEVVVLDFWATWCGPCKLAMPGLQELHEHYADQGLRVIGVNFGELADSDDQGLTGAKDYLGHYDYSYTFAQPADQAIADNYHPNLPMAVVIDRQGRIAEIYSGYFGAESDERLEAMIQSLL